MIQKIRIGMFGLIIFLTGYSFINAQNITSKGIDAIVKRSMEMFSVPGIAVSIIKNGEVIHSKGYGRRSLNSDSKVDENTLFAIASNSKAFTCATLGILVDEKKLDWDDKVIDYIPEFRLYDAYVSDKFTIRDLLTHRSGLGLGAGDLMIYPDSNDFTIDELIYNMRYLKAASGFRSNYAYNNQLYIIAGEIVARISGMSWAEFVEQRIMKPLGMSNSAVSFQWLKEKSNVAAPHAIVNNELINIDRYDLELLSSAGGIYSSINDMSKWVILQLNGGKYGNENKQLISKEVHKEMWTPQTIIQSRTGGTYKTHFNAYALGWRLCDVNGYLEVSHTGGLPGMITNVTLLPELNLGIIIFTNQQSSEAYISICNHIKDCYLDIKGIDHVTRNYQLSRSASMAAQEKVNEVWNEIKNREKETLSEQLDYLPYCGTYKDSWFGVVTISEIDGKLRFESKRSPKLSGEMFWYIGNTFVVKWGDRSLDADAFVLFELNYEGQPTNMTLKAISPLTDFSFDFHDLELNRAKE